MSKMVRVVVDEIPEGEGAAFQDWCIKYECRPVGSGRRAWCGRFSTYLRSALGVATTPSGEQFLIYAEDLEDTP